MEILAGIEPTLTCFGILISTAHRRCGSEKTIDCVLRLRCGLTGDAGSDELFTILAAYEDGTGVGVYSENGPEDLSHILHIRHHIEAQKRCL